MITNTGKNILAKYLTGQAPVYASHIALGCGPKPLNTDGTFGDYSNKTSLDFEMFRVPIISRGYVTEDNISKIVFTAELPTEERYEITEVGVFSSGSNPSAGAYDSKIIYSFSDIENWEYHGNTSAIDIPTIYTPLDGSDNDNIINDVYPVFQTNADNRVFTDSNRSDRYERCRFLNNMIMIVGDNSDLGIDGNNHIIVNSQNHIHLTDISVDFNKNAPTDELRLAFSVINKDPDPAIVPDGVRLLIEFASTDIANTGQFARFEVNIENGIGENQNDFNTNRYLVVSKQLQELYRSTGFTWNAVTVVKIYATVLNNGVPSNDFYVALDALRLENISTINPLYGLTGYSVVKNTDAEPIIKLANTTNYVEFRFAMDVQ